MDCNDSVASQNTVNQDMKTYAYQLDIHWENKEANYQKIRQLTDQSQPEKGSLIVLPEMFATGFSMNEVVTQECDDGPTETFLKAFAQQTDCYVIGGLTKTRTDGKPTNDALLITPDGHRLGAYSKIHPFSMGKEGEHYADGNQVYIFENQILLKLLIRAPLHL